MQRNIYFYIVTFIFLTALAHAQKPEITSINKISETVLNNVLIEGSGFDNDPQQLQVYFGAVKANIVSSSTTEIIAQVPPGSTYDAISVTNLTSRLTGFSSELFTMYFQGKEFDPDKLDSVYYEFENQAGLNNICICDFNGDGKADVASSNNSSNITIFKNTGTLEVPEFERTEINTHTPTKAITCEDLNGDGKKDIVVAQDGGSQIFVVRNNSSNGSIDFLVEPQRLFVSGRVIPHLKVLDINKDGKPEIMAIDQQSQLVAIYKNKSTEGFLEFDFTPTTISFPDFPTANGLAVADFNNNGLPDIAITSSGNNRLAINKNTSTNGEISFENPFFIQLQNGGENLIAADVNGDGLNDLAITSNGSSVCNIIINTSNSSSISFEDNVFSTNIPGRPFSVSAGDLNGDGKADLVISSQFEQKLIFLINKVDANIDFDVVEYSLEKSGKGARNVQLADINGNGKTDVIFSRRESNSLGVLLNKNCTYPVFYAENKIITCKSPFRIETTKGIGLTYAWEKDGVAIPDESEYFLEVTSGGMYNVILESEGCSKEKEIEVIMQNSENASESVVDLVAENAGLCEGSEMKIKTLENYFIAYEWSHGDFNTSEVSIDEPGVYKVTVEIEPGCFAQGEIEVVSLKKPDITIEGKRKVRQDEQVQLQAQGALSYRWEPEEGLDDPYIANPLATIHEDITYTVIGTDENGCINEVSFEIIIDNGILPKGRSLFSPNGDGVDDEWFIEDIEGFTEYKVVVFDQLGNKVFEHEQHEQPDPTDQEKKKLWDGTVNGKPVKEGAYFYLITSPEIKKRVAGSITIIR